MGPLCCFESRINRDLRGPTHVNTATGSLTSDKLHTRRIPASHLPRQPVLRAKKIHSLGPPYFYFSQLVARSSFPSLFFSFLQPRVNTSSTSPNSPLLLLRNTQRKVGPTRLASSTVFLSTSFQEEKPELIFLVFLSIIRKVAKETTLAPRKGRHPGF